MMNERNCRRCERPFTPKCTGRPPEFCSTACRRQHDNAVKMARRALEANERELTKVRLLRSMQGSASRRELLAQSEATWENYVADSRSELIGLLG